MATGPPRAELYREPVDSARLRGSISGSRGCGFDPASLAGDEVFLELTRSICPLCKRVVDVEVNIR
jgi:hypothetical protein